MKPLISVILPVWNGAEYLRDSINSILNQSFSDFELIVVNDGSTDDTGIILNEYSDDRIKVFTHHQNKGLIHSLNLGIAHASGKYLARMDADDISLPQRFERQLDYLEKNPGTGVCGSFIKISGGAKKISFFSSDREIRTALLWQCELAHPAVMIRRELISELVQPYNPSFLHAEDYELWTRLALRTAFFNIPEVLLQYRLHPAQVSIVHRELQEENTQRARIAYLASLGISLNETESFLFQKLIRGRSQNGFSDLCLVFNLLDRIEQQLESNRSFHQDLLHEKFREFRKNSLLNYFHRNPFTYGQLFDAPLNAFQKIPLHSLASILVKKVFHMQVNQR